MDTQRPFRLTVKVGRDYTKNRTEPSVEHLAVQMKEPEILFTITGPLGLFAFSEEGFLVLVIGLVVL
jgi:hypothetical protein